MDEDSTKKTSFDFDNHITNNLRTRKIRDKYLISTDHGTWAALGEKEYRSLNTKEISEELFNLLEEKGIIITPKNIWHILEDYKLRNGFLFNGTSLHIIVPTLRCNHKCVYCHSSAKNSNEKNQDMDFETAKKTLDFIFQTPAKTITIEFQGGDALLNSELFKFIVLESKKMNKLFNKKIRFALVTNLTLMNDDIARFVCEENVDVCTSLDGPKNVHDKNRVIEGGKPSYDEVTKWMKILEEKYDKPVAALMVTTRYSLSFWKEIVDEYVRWNINSLQIKYLNKLGFAEKEWKEIGYSIEEFIDFWKKSLDYMIELNKKGIKIKDRFATLILKKIMNPEDPNFLDFRNPCGIVTGQLAYNYNGDIYCCDEGRNYEMFIVGNVKTDSYTKVLSDKKSQHLIGVSVNDCYVCDNCIYKPFCGLCPVLSYAEDNNIISNIGKSNRCKLFKAQFDYVFEKLLYDKEIKDIFLSWLGNNDYDKNRD